MIKNINTLEEAIGLEKGKLAEMISAEEEMELDLGNYQIESKDTVATREKNLKTQSAAMANEVLIKKMRNEFELEFEGKTEENLFEALKARDEKIKSSVITDPEGELAKTKKELEKAKGDFTKMQTNFKTVEQEFTAFKQTSADTQQKEQIKNLFVGSIEGETLVSKSTIFTEAREKGFSFEIGENGVAVVKDKAGEVVKHEKTLEPIALKDWAAEFSTPYIKGVEGGGGGGDDTKNAKAGTMEAFEAEAKKAGWNASQVNTEMAKRIKDGSLKV